MTILPASNDIETSRTGAETVSAEIERILILGDSGFIGQRVKSRLETQFPQIGVVGSSESTLDLTQERDSEKLADFFDLQTTVVMCAGIKRQLGDNLDTFSSNVRMVVNLCRQLEQHPVKRLIFFSSAAVYGEENHNTNISEETPVHPTSFYGAAKYAAECLLEKVVVRAHRKSSLLILRPPVIYGPGDTGSGYGPSGFVRAALKGETIDIWGDGGELREFIFVEDVAKIVGELALSEHTEVLNLASGKSYTYRKLLDFIASELGRKVQTVPRARSKEKVDHGFCNAALRKALPGFCFTSPEEGIRRLIAAQGAG